MTDENVTNINSLPNEILDLIFRYLSPDKATMYNCIRVCRTWNDLGIRYLWARFVLSSDSKMEPHYQSRLFKVLEADETIRRGFYNTGWSAFSHTKEITLVCGSTEMPILRMHQCDAIVTKCLQIQCILPRVAPHIERLHLVLSPLVEQDIGLDEEAIAEDEEDGHVEEHHGLWSRLNQANAIINRIARESSV